LERTGDAAQAIICEEFMHFSLSPSIQFLGLQPKSGLLASQRVIITLSASEVAPTNATIAIEVKRERKRNVISCALSFVQKGCLPPRFFFWEPIPSSTIVERCSLDFSKSAKHRSTRFHFEEFERI